MYVCTLYVCVCTGEWVYVCISSPSSCVHSASITWREVVGGQVLARPEGLKCGHRTPIEACATFGQA